MSQLLKKNSFINGKIILDKQEWRQLLFNFNSDSPNNPLFSSYLLDLLMAWGYNPQRYFPR